MLKEGCEARKEKGDLLFPLIAAGFLYLKVSPALLPSPDVIICSWGTSGIQFIVFPLLVKPTTSHLFRNTEVRELVLPHPESEFWCHEASSLIPAPAQNILKHVLNDSNPSHLFRNWMGDSCFLQLLPPWWFGLYFCFIPLLVLSVLIILLHQLC